MRRFRLVPWFLPLFFAGCGLQSSGPTVPDQPAPVRSPGTMLAPLSLGGKVYVAQAPLAADYRLAPDGTEVSYRVAGTRNWKTVLAKGGEYLFEGVPRSLLEVRATYPGLGSRTLEFTPSSGAKILDFSEKNNAYLVDALEVVDITPPLSQKWDPSKPLTISIRFSEELDPKTFDPALFSLRSSDIKGLSVTDGTPLFKATARVTLKGDTVTLTTNAPLANIRGTRYPLILLHYGQGVLKGKPEGAVLGNSEVVGYNLDGKKTVVAPEIPIRFWTDDSRPSLKRMVAVRNGEGYDVRLVFSEPMVVMLNDDQASGSFDPRVLEPSSYQLEASASAPVSLELSDLALDPNDTASVRGRIIAVRENPIPSSRSLLPVDPAPFPLLSLTVKLLDLSDPAGNLASGSAKVSF